MLAMEKVTDLITMIISAVTGGIAGGIGSLVAPWANWGVEKKRIIYEQRRELIAKARMVLNKPLANTDFRHTELYSRLRPHLSSRAITAIEGTRTNDGGEIVRVSVGSGRGSGINTYAHLVLDELAKLEKKWGLI